MKKYIVLFIISIFMALLPLAAAILGWRLGLSLPFDITVFSKQVLAVLVSALFAWGSFIVGRKALTMIIVKRGNADYCKK